MEDKTSGTTPNRNFNFTKEQNLENDLTISLKELIKEHNYNPENISYSSSERDETIFLRFTNSELVKNHEAGKILKSLSRYAVETHYAFQEGEYQVIHEHSPTFLEDFVTTYYSNKAYIDDKSIIEDVKDSLFFYNHFFHTLFGVPDSAPKPAVQFIFHDNILRLEFIAQTGPLKKADLKTELGLSLFDNPSIFQIFTEEDREMAISLTSLNALPIKDRNLACIKDHV